MKRFSIGFWPIEFTTVIIELKKVASEEGLDPQCEEDLKQIHDRKYYLNMHGRIVLAGIAFWGKMPKVITETIVMP